MYVSYEILNIVFQRFIRFQMCWLILELDLYLSQNSALAPPIFNFYQIFSW